MDLDLNEYDQVDDRIYCDGSSSKFMVTMSSCSSEQTSVDDSNCENDFVFLPSPNNPNQDQIYKQQQLSQPAKPQGGENSKNPSRRSDKELESTATRQSMKPLLNSSKGNGSNPFGDAIATAPTVQREQSQAIAKRILLSDATKPVGPLALGPSSSSNPIKLAEIMHQIVTRSDLIYIAIPCAYCQEILLCPPSDITNFLNHMSSQHNCKVCPICNKLVGLGPSRDLDIIKQHVLEHLDKNWLERKATKVSFTHGLQQQWFSSNKCVVEEPQRHR